MALITPVPPEQAEGIIKEGYDFFMERVGTVPKPLEMISVSPVLFEMQMKRLKYLSQHPNLSMVLLSHIRYLVSSNLAYQTCTDFNKYVLQKQGVSDDDFKMMAQDPSQARLEDNEIAMLLFVLNSVKDPTSVGKSDIENLKKMGWEDRDLVDALAQGVNMIDHSIMMQVFQMDQDCMTT